MNNCTRERIAQMRDRVRCLAKKFAGSVMLASQLEPLVRALETPTEAAAAEVAVRLRELVEIAPVLGAAMKEHDLKESTDRAEAFLADLAEDRDTAPAELVPLVDQYIARLREVIARSWDRRLTRREIDAYVLQVRLSYSQDLDRILHGLYPAAG